MTYGIYEKYRELRGKTNYEVSKKTGISQQYLSKWKNSPKMSANPKTIMPIIKFLRIPATEVLK